MKKILRDYFGAWRTGRLGRTRFFALSVFAGLASFALIAAIMFLGVSFGLIENSVEQPSTETLESAALHLVVDDGSAALRQNVQDGFRMEVVQHSRYQAPWGLAFVVFHLFFANISMKRLRDIGLAGAWFYLGSHALIIAFKALPGGGFVGSLLLFFLAVILIFGPTGWVGSDDDDSEDQSADSAEEEPTPQQA